MNFTLRSAQASDVPALYALDCLCFEPPFRFTLHAMRRFASASRAVVHLAECGASEAGSATGSSETHLAGFVILHLPRGPGSPAYVVTLDVHPNNRRSGIASALMSSATSAARAAGVSAIHLHVHSANTPAIHFYERRGYARETLARDFYGPNLDAWLYSLSVRP